MSKMLLARSRRLLSDLWHGRTHVQQRCRVCGCTNWDCRQCIERTGHPCSWAEPDLCSACVGPGVVEVIETQGSGPAAVVEPAVAFFDQGRCTIISTGGAGAGGNASPAPQTFGVSEPGHTLMREAEQTLKDAARYRFLRDNPSRGLFAGSFAEDHRGVVVAWSGEQLDHQVDMAMRGTLSAPDYDTAMDAATWGNHPEAEADLRRLQDKGHTHNCRCLHCVTARGAGGKL